MEFIRGEIITLVAISAAARQWKSGFRRRDDNVNSVKVK
jgi:hypothetical protein